MDWGVIVRKSGVISVIVPVYGVEKYLEQCIESILGQTYPNLEVILIDDGSPDRCGEICDRYARMDSRVNVIHKENGGAASARNAGLRMAAGEYLTFVDGDDFLPTDAYENLLGTLVRQDADIVHGKIEFLYVNGRTIPDGRGETVSFSAAGYLEEFLTDWTCGLSTVKLFRHSVLTGVFYEEGHRIDDEFFTYRAVMNAEKIVCIPTVVYQYRQRASSVMQNRDTMEEKYEDIFAYLEQRSAEVIARFPQLRGAYEAHYADYLLYLAGTEMATKRSIRGIKKRLLRYTAQGKSLFWKKGQRKRTLRILAFLLTPAAWMRRGGNGGTDDGYQCFE